MPKIKANEVEIYYEIHGNQGPPLLLIMGLASDSSHFSMQIGKLSQYYKVIVFDNRGIGRTETTQGDYTVAMMANDILSLLNALPTSEKILFCSAGSPKLGFF